MAIAETVSNFLVDRHVDYHVFPHPYSETALDSATALHVDPEDVAKGVVVATKAGRRRTYCVAVIPANRAIHLHEFEEFSMQRLELAKEYELTVLFPDCAVGAVPILGEAYGLPTVIDTALKLDNHEIFFEAGDHQELLRIEARQLLELLPNVEFAPLSRPLTEAQVLRHRHYEAVRG